ncbi:MAG: hypothetical protein KGZ93_11205 [Actinobacteria bacterium]|nr:hypothetical protein [Actinomycetota bacterium]
MSSPSYLESVNNNVNRQVHEDYHDYISGCKEHGIILWRDEEQKYIFIPYYELGRYSEGGRKAISRKLKKALGRKNVRKGVFITLTFAQTGVDLLSCWVNIGNEIRKFLNNVKMWKKRRGHKGSLDYFWIVEPHRGNNNYPHVHIFFPGLEGLR